MLSTEIKNRQKKGKLIYLDRLLTGLAESNVEQFAELGIDVSTEEFERDFYYFLEAGRAILCRNIGLKHDLHSLLNAGVKETDADGNEIWQYTNPKPRRAIKTGTTIEIVETPIAVANTANSIV
jgi:hypothetical protein